MRALLLLLLVSSPALFAADKTPEEKRDDALYQWRVGQRWQGLNTVERAAKYDEYLAKHTEVWNQYGTEQLAALTAGCPNNTDCVTTEQKDLLAAQVRISIGVVKVKVRWIKEGKSEAEQKTAEDNFNKCVTENKDCDKLHDNDRGVANDARGSGATVTVTPSTDVKTQLDAGLAVIAAELLAKKEEFLKNNPSAESREMTASQKEFLLATIKEKMEKELALMKSLCDKNPGVESVCSEEAINKVKDFAAMSGCLVDRNAAKKGADLSKHVGQWGDLPDPKTCQTLLDHDAKPVTPEVVKPDVETPEVVVEGDDEKSPRNYKVETCKWVSDLPRKIVNGPSCGKTRSKICTGYVVCEQKTGGGKFIRMSTCGPDKCGGSDEDAVKCTKDQGYWSVKPASETKLFMSKKLKETLSGNEAQ